jgi:hypothetical protein
LPDAKVRGLLQPIGRREIGYRDAVSLRDGTQRLALLYGMLALRMCRRMQKEDHEQHSDGAPNPT